MKKIHGWKDWLVAVRPWSFPASAMPVAVTLVYLWWLGERVDWLNGVWALLDIIVFHAAGNAWSDYFDYRRGVDRKGAFCVDTLTSGRFQPREIFGLSAGLLAVALAGGAGLAVALSRFKIQGVGGCGDIFSIRFVAGVGDGLCGNGDGGLGGVGGGGAGGVHYGGYFACQ